MRTIESIKENEVVHCPTEEQAIAFCKLAFPNESDRWAKYWHTERENTCYDVNYKGYADVDFYRKNGKKIIDFSKFSLPLSSTIFDLQETQKQIEHTQKILADLVEIQSRIDQDHYLKGQKITLTDKTE